MVIKIVYSRNKFCIIASFSEAPSQRPKRRRVDKTGRLEALEKIRNLKGKKNKYDVDTIQNVYDVVNEEEYKSRVLEKASADWLEEDGKCGKSFCAL